MLRDENRCLLIPVVFLALVALPMSGFVIFTTTSLDHPSWRASSFPIVVQIWEGLNDGLPNIVDGSDPKLAVREALQRWAEVSSLSMVIGPDTSVQEAAWDGVNVVTGADTTANRNATVNGLAVNFAWQTSEQTVISESDVVFNPTVVASTLEGGSTTTTNLLDTAVHEFGHGWNLEHSNDWNSVMFGGGGDAFDLGFNQLAWDDIAAVNRTYPLIGLDQITGTISGGVTRQGSPVFGAFVGAVDETGVLACTALTSPDGTYKLPFLAPGKYALYVEPLDGLPMTPSAVSPRGIFGARAAEFVTDFLPQFYNNLREPSVIVASDVTGIDFAVTQGASTVDPRFLGVHQDVSGGTSQSTPASGLQGFTGQLLVVGQGVDKLLNNQGAFFLGSKLVTGSVARTATNAQGIHFKWFPLTIPEDAPRGEYPVFLQSNPELGVMSGALEVFSALRFGQIFAQFTHLPGGSASSALFLINTSNTKSAAGKIATREGEGKRATVSLGSLAADTKGDRTFNLNPSGSLLVRTTGQSSFVGSLRALADQSIGGTVLFETAFGTTGVGPSRPLFSFVAPVVKDPGKGQDTGLAIANLDEREVKLFVRAQAKDGTVLASTTIVLPANGQLAKFSAQLVPGIPDVFSGTFVVTANRQIAATVILTAPGFFTTFPVIQNRIISASFFAQFAHVPAAGLTSRLILVNPSPTREATVQIRVRNQQGSMTGLTLNGESLANGLKNITIAPLGCVILETGGSDPLIGSVQVSSERPAGNGIPVGGVVLFSSPAVGTAGVGESFPLSKMVVPIERDTSRGTDAGIAIVNTRDQKVTLVMTVRDSSGTSVAGPKEIVLEPRNQLARFPNESPLSFNLPAQFTGSLWIEVKEAGLEVAVTVIRQSPGVLTTFPAISLQKVITPAG